MLLINPPIAKPCEPPAGIARLAGFLRGHGRAVTLLDANLEGQLFLLNQPRRPPADTWSRRACANLEANLAALRQEESYRNIDRYQRGVADVNRVLGLAGDPVDLSLSLANYQDRKLSPLKSVDLLATAARPQENIFYPYFEARLEELLAAVQPALVGLSLNYLSQALTTFALAGFLKERWPELPIVLGGGLVTSWLHNPKFTNPFGGLIDHLVAGPGEEPLLELLGGGAQPVAPWAPSYEGLPLADYLAPGPILPYAASAGCYWRKCSFCPEKAEANPYRSLPVDRVLGEIDTLRAAVGPVLLHFLDNAVSPALLRGLAARPPGLDWYGFARVDKQLADFDFCQGLRRAGCRLLKLGIESGDQGVLDGLAKGIDLGLVSRVLTNLQRAGIASYVYLLFGTPVETEKAARATLDFVVRHRAAITFLNLAIFNLPVTSPEAAGLTIRAFSQADLALYVDFEHPQGWHRQKVRRFLDREFRRHPAVAPILRRDPVIFTSNHAAFFC